MKISATLTLLSMAHVSSAAMAIGKSTEINSLAAAVGAGQQVTAFPGPPTSSVLTGVSTQNQIGSAAVRQSGVVASGVGGSAVLSGGQQNLVQAQSRVGLPRLRAE
ncbi:uncharacterized protein LOC144140830 [Haemaphysalis longicornis]